LPFKLLLGDISIGHRKIPLAYVIWFALALIAVLAELLHHSINNYLVFKNVFWHVLDAKSLYIGYPDEYFDHNMYGPVFSFVIAPFSILPDWIGVILWVMFNGVFLFYAIKQLPLSEKAIKVILLIAAVEFMTACHNVQFNPMVAAWIILSYTLVEKEKDFWATFFLVLGLLSKVYGIVGVLFFVFSKHKIKYIASGIFWLIVLFSLPMVISSPAFIIQAYKDWVITLSEKNLHNIEITEINMQDLSVMGMTRRIFKYPQLSNLAIIVPAAILMGLPLLRMHLYKYKAFKLQYVALALISVVVFSSGAESSTYVIAMAGVAIWFAVNMHQGSKLNVTVLILALLVTSFGTTDLIPNIIKHRLIRAYSLKALPCFIVWTLLIYNVAFKKETALE
jgi:hypothetical protein